MRPSHRRKMALATLSARVPPSPRSNLHHHHSLCPEEGCPRTIHIARARVLPLQPRSSVVRPSTAARTLRIPPHHLQLLLPMEDILPSPRSPVVLPIPHALPNTDKKLSVIRSQAVAELVHWESVIPVTCLTDHWTHY